MSNLSMKRVWLRLARPPPFPLDDEQRAPPYLFLPWSCVRFGCARFGAFSVTSADFSPGMDSSTAMAPDLTATLGKARCKRSNDLLLLPLRRLDYRMSCLLYTPPSFGHRF